MKKYNKIIEFLMTDLSFSDRILIIIFRKFTYKILRKGIDIGFNWEEKDVNLNVKKSANCQPRYSSKKENIIKHSNKKKYNNR